jgi:long-chain acyl-CoA synthetase
VHRALGGRLRRLVTDGEPLEPEAARLFSALGLDVNPNPTSTSASAGLAAPGIDLASNPPPPASPAPRRRRAPLAEVDVPAPLAALGRRLLGVGQKALYEQLYGATVVGRAFIPHDRNVLVVANHASHLDMGLVKVALAEEGERLAALAARDYFFDTPLKRAYFGNFTSLVPMERDGSLRRSLRAALTTLARGRHLLIFPEGTRTRDGEMRPFFPTAGFLALHARVDVLPAYLSGTFEAFPPSASFPRKAALEVRFGEPIRLADLEALSAGVSKAEGYRRATRVMEEAVRGLGGRSPAATTITALNPSPASNPTSTPTPTATAATPSSPTGRHHP